MEAILTFMDGTVIEAEENGNCFIVPVEPEFPEDLSQVTVEDETGEKTLQNVTVQETASVDGRFCLDTIAQQFHQVNDLPLRIAAFL